MAAHAAGRGRSRPSESRPPRGTGGRHPSRRGRVRGLEAGPGVAEEEQVAAVELPEPLEVAVRQLAVHPGHDRGRHRLAAASVCGAAGAPGAPCQRGRSKMRGEGRARGHDLGKSMLAPMWYRMLAASFCGGVRARGQPRG